ncbi:MAG: four-helix bundle copper-binding protein [Pseudomonadota bacterium]
MENMMDSQRCIEACTHCSQTCLQMAMTHCLEEGGQHVEPEHFRLMMDCAEVCQTSARLQLSGSQFMEEFCALCAEICLSCADSCERVGNMQACVEACQACARSCEEMSGMAS